MLDGEATASKSFVLTTKSFVGGAGMAFFSEALASAMSHLDGNLAAANEPLVAPFRIIADFREAIDGWQFTNLPDREHPTRCWTVPVEYRYLETADYTVEELTLFIVRHKATDLLVALQQWPESFAQERAE